MGLITEYAGSTGGYEAVPLPPTSAGAAGTEGANASVLRRRSARPSRQAVLYVQCHGDLFVPSELAAWYVDRGFHFYVADLRTAGRAGQPGSARADASVAGELAECFACLDAAAAHLREADAIDTVVVSAHAAGAVIAALWSHARRGSQPVDALVLASPELGPGGRRQARPAAGAGGAGGRYWPLLAGAQRRLRRGLDIACPVLVMCPGEGWDAPGGPGGLLGWRLLFGSRAITRLGAHVTWMKLDGGQPGEALPAPEGRKRFFDELGRWLGAYLSGQVRDQLL
jgi:hypothetical protein